jgi:SAM-dependent methyltransferase
MRNFRLYPRIYSRDYLTLTGLRLVLKNELGTLRGTVVDFGCGSQPYRSLIPAGCRYVGADLTASGPETVALEPGGRLPFEDVSVDVVLSTQVIEHVKDVVGYLAECRRVLRTGGRLILTTHGNWPYHPWPPIVEDYWRWTSVGLRTLVADRGFCVQKVQPSCEGKFSLIQQLLALHDPARNAPAFWRRCGRAGWALGWNLFALLGQRLAPGWMRTGDILPVDFLIVAEKN